MSRQSKWIMGILAGFFLVVVLFADMWTKSTGWFKGDRQKNPDSYTLSITSMNGKDSHTIHASKGQKLVIQYNITSGGLSFTVGKKNQAPLYEEKQVKEAKMTFTIPENGDYIITVRARRAKGEFRAYISQDKNDKNSDKKN